MREEMADKIALSGSLLLFTRVFFRERMNRDFIVSSPPSRQSHHRQICEALMRCEVHEISRLMIAVAPRYGKTELVINFIAWCLARWPDANFLYVSYSYELAVKQTATVKEILSLPLYQRLFETRIKRDASAKGNFETIQGGSVYAAGAAGTITGRGAGIQAINRFGGAIIIDDIHKPIEALSDTTRETIHTWYSNTLKSRLNDPVRTPIIFIGQRLHEDDLQARLLAGSDTEDWNKDKLILKSLDDAGNALHPTMHTAEMLKNMLAKTPYDTTAQHQQDPMPAGGAVFKKDWFVLLDDEPDYLCTFLTVDSAETDKNWNDQTVFSYWGFYRIMVTGIDTDMYGLHWIDCEADWIEAKDLKDRFTAFYGGCLRHNTHPKFVAIEKKSTGVTLSSTLKEVRGINIIDLGSSGEQLSKSARFNDAQGYVANKLISLPSNGIHTQMCIEHMSKITLNDSHRLDDIADTMAYAVRIALIQPTVRNMTVGVKRDDKIIADLASGLRQAQNTRRAIHGY